MAYSAKNERAIDLKNALTYPLGPIPLALAHPDGSRRTTTESQLMDEILTYCNDILKPEEFYKSQEKPTAYLIDLMALIRTMAGLGSTYEELALKVLDRLPKSYDRIDIVVDTYRQNSLKNPERTRRGTTEKVLVQSAKSRLLRNFNDFLKNGENKTRLIEIIEAVIIKRKDEILERLKCNEVLFSRDQVCTRITKFPVESVDSLSSNQEEADTKLMLHDRDVLVDAVVLVRSPSGDIDINVLFINMFQAESERIYIDFGTGKSRKIFRLTSIDMSEELKSAILGFHAFTGNDYVSSIFGKSKKICWKAVTKSSKYARMFNRLGETVNLDENSITLLEEFVCSLYRKNKKDINQLHYEIFQTMYEKKGKIQDLSLLPPCGSSFQLHCKCSNYVAKMWRSSLSCNIDPDNIQNHG